ncbi:hypothetical protein [Bacteroidetes bacterium endosymbiont of Geopemphigus sp.]|uniref:hypothetical protein n=1 Tax=Bacteroidetes bacterium endosymbiont of Geopemphigus sp. TaxID=2047937 RepID=UPI000CD2B3E8|nr:hypothetical protein [Bacteroidetes bacterium endosymbiont of Geopemphigus sp.]
MKERKKQLLRMVEKIKNAGIECEGILKEDIPSDFILEVVMEKILTLSSSDHMDMVYSISSPGRECLS